MGSTTERISSTSALSARRDLIFLLTSSRTTAVFCLRYQSETEFSPAPLSAAVTSAALLLPAGKNWSKSESPALRSAMRTWSIGSPVWT